MLAVDDTAVSDSSALKNYLKDKGIGDTVNLQVERDGKVLTLAYAEGGKTLNPTQGTDSTSAEFINAAYDQLVTYGSKTNDQGYEMVDTSDIQPVPGQELGGV